jgi:hypothetical protein
VADAEGAGDVDDGRLFGTESPYYILGRRDDPIAS